MFWKEVNPSHYYSHISENNMDLKYQNSLLVEENEKLRKRIEKLESELKLSRFLAIGLVLKSFFFVIVLRRISKS